MFELRAGVLREPFLEKGTGSGNKIPCKFFIKNEPVNFTHAFI
jgi:hypothetical protein